MEFHVKKHPDWEYYAYYAIDVEERHWGLFDYWWQLGDSFIRVYDNVKDFSYCAENYSEYAEPYFKQQMGMIPVPWEKALDWFIAEIGKTGVDWYIHGSTAMALWGIDVEPKGVDIIIPNYSDFDKVREHFREFAIFPIERCENWVMSGLGNIFMEAGISLAFHNRELEPYGMGGLGKAVHNGRNVFISNLETLKWNNECYGRPERVALIEERMKQNI